MDKQYKIFRKICESILLIALLILGIGSQAFAQFQNVKPFTQRVGTPAPPDGIFRIKGDYTLIGNTNLTVEPYGDNTENGFNQMVYVDVDENSQTLNSSSSTLQFSQENGADPNCSEILYAGLYWSGRSNSEQFLVNTIRVNTGNFNLLHNQSVGNGSTYTMTISRAGTANNFYPIYTFTSSGSGSTYAFHLTNNGTGPNNLFVFLHH